MKSFILLLSSFAFSTVLCAQKCLEMSISSLMGKLKAPGNSAKNFAACKTASNDKHQTVIVDYGTAMKDLDSLVVQMPRKFNDAAVAGSAEALSQMPSAQTVENSKQLAEILQSMTPEQQKEWAMQQANKQMANKRSHPAMQDNPAVTRLVMQTYDIAAGQLPAINREFAAGYRSIENAKSDALEKISEPNRSGCPSADKYGNPACSCVNDSAAKYFKGKVAAEDKFDAKKIALYQSYIGKIKELVQQVDENIAKLHYGADIKSKQYQKMLFSSQSAAFGNAFDIAYLTIQAIHKDGADLYVNKVNSDNNVYDLGCIAK